MALETYAQLQAAVANWIARDDLTSDIPDFIRLTEILIQKKLNISTQESIDTGTLTSGQDYLDAPSDMVEPVSLEIDANGKYTVDVVNMTRLTTLRENDDSGKPSGMVPWGTKLLLGPGPTGDHPYVLYYRSGIPSLASTGTNWILTSNPNLLLFGALVEATPFLEEDPRIVIWAAKFKELLDAERIQQFRRKSGGGVLRQRVDSYVP